MREWIIRESMLPTAPNLVMPIIRVINNMKTPKIFLRASWLFGLLIVQSKVATTFTSGCPAMRKGSSNSSSTFSRAFLFATSTIAACCA